MSVVVGAALLVVAVILFILQPMLSGRRASLHRETDEPTEAESRRRVTLLALRDVEYDHATGKLDEADYHALRKELAAEALTALERVDSETAAGPGGASSRARRRDCSGPERTAEWHHVRRVWQRQRRGK